MNRDCLGGCVLEIIETYLLVCRKYLVFLFHMLFELRPRYCTQQIYMPSVSDDGYQKEGRDFRSETKANFIKSCVK